MDVIWYVERFAVEHEQDPVMGLMNRRLTDSHVGEGVTMDVQQIESKSFLMRYRTAAEQIMNDC
jgi:hypothetical protein